MSERVVAIETLGQFSNTVTSEYSGTGRPITAGDQ